MMSLPAFTVVVCTRDRPALLARCLEALQRLEHPAAEIVVVDSASAGPRTAQVVARAQAGAARPLRYVREARPGLDRARNRGWAEARHTLIAFVDDDALPDPGWLHALAQAFADPQVAAVTGQVLPAELETPAQRLFEQYGGMGKGAQPRLFDRRQLRPRDLIAVHHAGVGANMAFRRSTLATLGGFDPALDVGTPAEGAGDLDMFHRLLTTGFTLRYEPAACVRHRHRRDLDGLRRQLYANGRSFGVYLIKAWCLGGVPRRTVARFAAGWVGGWLLARVALRLAGRLQFPWPLVWAELIGACSAPWAYAAAQRAALRHGRP